MNGQMMGHLFSVIQCPHEHGRPLPVARVRIVVTLSMLSELSRTQMIASHRKLFPIFAWLSDREQNESCRIKHERERMQAHERDGCGRLYHGHTKQNYCMLRCRRIELRFSGPQPEVLTTIRTPPVDLSSS